MYDGLWVSWLYYIHCSVLWGLHYRSLSFSLIVLFSFITKPSSRQHALESHGVACNRMLNMVECVHTGHLDTLSNKCKERITVFLLSLQCFHLLEQRSSPNKDLVTEMLQASKCFHIYSLCTSAFLSCYMCSGCIQCHHIASRKSLESKSKQPNTRLIHCKRS